MKKILTALTAISLFTMSSHAIANNSVGIGGGWTDSPYKGYGSVYYPIPNIQIDNGLFYIDDLSAGVYLYNDEVQDLSIGLSYQPLSFNPKDSDDVQLRALNKRHSTLLAEVRYFINTDIGEFAGSIAGDILDESNSILADVNYNYLFLGEKWVISPKIGVMWTNNKHNNYYFGISQRESNRSGLKYYYAKSSFTPYVQLSGLYRLTTNVSAYAGVNITQLTGDAADSPMIANDTVTSVFMGVSYGF